MKVIIAGAGIGGLTAALSLQKAGITCKVFEASPEILPLGVGINILPRAARELCELGLKPELDQLAIRTSAMNYYLCNGKLVISEPCGTYAGYRWPQWSMHRGELQMLLLRKFIEQAGAENVITAARLSNFVQTGNKVTAYFTNPANGAIFNEEADLLIGADGLHSATRKKMFPREEHPRYSGLVAYRGAVEAPSYLDGQTMAIIGDRTQRLICYPISKQSLDHPGGKSLINWIACIPKEQAGTPEDWTWEAGKEELLERYKDWRFNWLDVPALIGNTRHVFEFPLYDRDPHRQWTFGRVTLLGDAAHPMIPVSSNGAVQAIIDGRALAFALANAENPMAGLIDYEDDRLEKANRVVEASRRNGPDEVLEIALKNCPADVEYVQDYVSQRELQQIIDEFKETTGASPEQVNNFPSYDS